MLHLLLPLPQRRLLPLTWLGTLPLLARAQSRLLRLRRLQHRSTRRLHSLLQQSPRNTRATQTPAQLCSPSQ
jgi:hypothetical protein